MQVQKQRRYLVPTEAQDEWRGRFADATSCHDIKDGYFETSGARVMRVRVVYGFEFNHAFLTCKIGSGQAREVENFQLQTLDAGLRLLKQCPYVIEKRRLIQNHPMGAWCLDMYRGVLESLMILETGGDLAKPVSNGRLIEVTDSLSGLHFAKLAHELTHGSGSDPTDEAMRLAIRLPRIVLTGGPCSGKSTVMEALKKRFGDRLHCVPEVATIVIGQVGVKPWTGGARNLLSAQRLIYRAQRAFEDASDSQARTDGKTAMLLDRGVGDIRAYLPAGLSLEQLAHTTVEHEFARYDLVIVLDSPSRDVYEAHKGDNAARTETYEAAAELGRRIRDAWEGHPNFRFVADTATWEAKEAAVVAHVESFLSKPRP